MSIEKSQKLDIRPKEKTDPAYRYLRVNPDTAQGFAGALSTVRSSFTLPAIPMNDSRIRVNFRVAIPAVASTVPRLFMNGSNYIDRVKMVSTAGGPELVELEETALYTRCVNPMLMEEKEYLRLDSNLGIDVEASVNDCGSNLCPNRASTVSVAGTQAAPFANVTLKQFKAQAVRVNNDATDYEACDEPNEPRTCGSGVIAKAMYQKFSIPLAQIAPLSWLSNDKTSFCPADKTLELYFNAYNKVGFAGTSATDFSTGLTTLTGYTISDLHLMVPTEANDQIRESMEQAVKSGGMEFLVPRVRHVKQPTSGTAFSTNYKITSGDGHSLLAVISSIQDQTDTGIGNYNITNLESTNDTKAIGCKVVSQQSRLDSKTLSDSRLVCADMDDYNFIKDKLEDCAISSAKVWNYNRCFIDAWSDAKTCKFTKDFTNYIDGKDLKEKDLNYSIEGTTPSASQYLHLWIITQEKIRINPNGSVERF